MSKYSIKDLLKKINILQLALEDIVRSEVEVTEIKIIAEDALKETKDD